MGRAEKALKSLLPVATTAAALWLLTRFVDVDDIGERLGAMNPPSFLGASAAMVANVLVASWRQQVILKSLTWRHNIAIAPLFRLNLTSLFVSHFLPVAALADAIRAVVLQRSLRLPFLSSVESVVADRAYALLGLGTMGLLFLPLQVVDGWPAYLWLAQGAAFAAILAGAAIAYGVSRLGSLQDYRMIAFSRRAFAVVSSFRGVLLQATIAMVSLLLFACMVKWLADAIDMALPFWVALTIGAAIYLAQVIPIFYAGFGARELAALAIIVPAGVGSQTEAITLALSIGLCNVAASLPGAFLAWPIVRSTVRGHDGQSNEDTGSSHGQDGYT